MTPPVPTRRLAAMGLAVLVSALGCAARTWARDVEEPDVTLFDAPVTRGPAPERELGLHVSYERGRDGREVEAAAELAWRPWRRLEVSREVPLVLVMPREAPDVAGLGDLAVGAKVLAFQSVEEAP